MRTNTENPNTANKLAEKMGFPQHGGVKKLSEVTGMNIVTLTNANTGRAGGNTIAALNCIGELWDELMDWQKKSFLAKKQK